MEKRNFKRISASVDARFLYGDMFYSGTILNLSEKGMFISTKICLPSSSIFVLIVRIKDDLLKVHARVKWVTKMNDYYDGMGVEILNPQKKYLEFIDSLRLGINLKTF